MFSPSSRTTLPTVPGYAGMFQMWSVVDDSPGTSPQLHNPYKRNPQTRGALCVAWDVRETDIHPVLVSLAGRGHLMVHL